MCTFGGLVLINRINRTQLKELSLTGTRESPSAVEFISLVRRSMNKSGVPTNKIFEHLEATIAEATPLYELCENVLNASQ